MMIKHIVLFKFKSKTTNEDILTVKKELAKLKDKISGINDFLWGANISPEHKGKGFEYGFIMTFENKECRNEYLSHSEHQKCVSTFLDPIVEDVLVFDIEEIANE